MSLALKVAIAVCSPPRGCIFHSARGSQCCAHDYQKIRREHGFKVSMSGKGNCYDNAAVETFFKTIKAELIWRRSWETRQQAEIAIFQYINGFYNPRRRHSALGGKSPLAFERKVAYTSTCSGTNTRQDQSGSARQANGPAPSLLRSATKLLMAACRSTTERNTPCVRRRRASVAKKPSTAFSHELKLGVKGKVGVTWKVGVKGKVGMKGKVWRGWRFSHARTYQFLWAAYMSSIARMTSPA